MPKTKTQKREEAEARQEAYLARTANEQMNLVRRRPGDSLKERDKLIARIESGMAHKGGKK